MYKWARESLFYTGGTYRWCNIFYFFIFPLYKQQRPHWDISSVRDSRWAAMWMSITNWNAWTKQQESEAKHLHSKQWYMIKAVPFSVKTDFQSVFKQVNKIGSIPCTLISCQACRKRQIYKLHSLAAASSPCDTCTFPLCVLYCIYIYILCFPQLS